MRGVLLAEHFFSVIFKLYSLYTINTLEFHLNPMSFGLNISNCW